MIPVFEPQVGAEEIEAVVAALEAGEISGSFGESIPAFERAVAEQCGVRHGIAVTSGTTALHMAVSALGLEPGDEVLVSATTNIATALAVHHNGLVTVPVDSESDTWNLDLTLIDDLVTDRTRAIIPVHVYGHPVDMTELMVIAGRHGLSVIEDCAESQGAACRGQMTGSFGDMGCLSFYANKVVTTGEGGMVVTNSDQVADRLRLLRNLAFTTPRFRHEIPAFNFRMTGYQAAMGIAQMRKIESIVERKRWIADVYRRYLEDIPGVQLPVEKEWARNVYWMFAIVIHSEFGLSRDELALHLRTSGIDTRTFFCPLDQQPFLRAESSARGVHCPVSNDLWQTGMYLPSSLSLDESTIEKIAGEIKRVRTRRAAT